jgi:7-cyano-7-deazaguanine synthase
MSRYEKAVVLLSGGLDSTTALAVADRECDKIALLSFDYKQRHKIELEQARKIGNYFWGRRKGQVPHYVQEIDLRLWGGSALTGDAGVPKDRPVEEMSRGIPITYVPARNTVFLAFAASLAEATGAEAIYGGWNALDYSGYPDCRPEFIQAMQEAIRQGTRVGQNGLGIIIEAPLILKSKADIIKLGLELGAPYDLTWSCYDPQKSQGYPYGCVPCGRCDSCLLRAKGFAEAGMSDPALEEV